MENKNESKLYSKVKHDHQVVSQTDVNQFRNDMSNFQQEYKEMMLEIFNKFEERRNQHEERFYQLMDFQAERTMKICIFQLHGFFRNLPSKLEI